MQRNPPNSTPIPVKKGKVLRYCITGAELEDLSLRETAYLNRWIQESAARGFFEKTADYSQFKKDFIDRPSFYVEEKPFLGVSEVLINHIKTLPPEKQIREVISILGNKFGENAPFLIEAAGQQVAGFVYGVTAHGIQQEENISVLPMEDPDVAEKKIIPKVASKPTSPIISGIPIIEDYKIDQPSHLQKFIDVFKNPVDQQTYFIAITKHLKLVSLPGSAFGLISAPSIVLYRLDDFPQDPKNPGVSPKKAFKLIAAEYDNSDLYLLARNVKIPAAVLKENYFPPKTDPNDDFDFLGLLHRYKAQLTKDIEASPAKIKKLQDIVQNYKQHLKEAISAIVNDKVFFQALTAPTFSEDENAKLIWGLEKSPPKVEIIGEELVRTGKYTGADANLITPECAQAILKYMTILKLERTLNADMHNLDKLDKFEVIFMQNQEQLKEIRDASYTTRFFKTTAQLTSYWGPGGEKFVGNVLEVLQPAPTATALGLALDPNVTMLLRR